MVQTVEGNIVRGYRVIAHQCNCKSPYKGGGVHQDIARATGVYRNLVNSQKVAGSIEIFENENFIVINMYAQLNPGKPRKYVDTREFRFALFRQCLTKLKLTITHDEQFRNKVADGIAIPKYIGCGTGGGNWSEYEQAIKDFESDCNITVTLVELSEEELARKEQRRLLRRQ